MMEISSMADAQRHIRNIRRVLLVLTLIIALYSYFAFASRVSDKMYTNIQSDHYCSRRLNATHQMGCTSKLGGNLGIVWMVQQAQDLDHILRDGPTPPYIAILNREYYTRKNLLDFKANPDRIAGVIFLDGNHDDSRLRSTPFSPEDRCPNRYSGLYVNDTQYGDCKHNFWQRESQVSGLLYDDFPYPIFLINERKSIEAIESCFNDNNVIQSGRTQSTYPLCGVQLDSFMVAAGNSEICLNSHSFVDELLQTNGRRCHVVSNQNIFAYYKTAAGPFQPLETSPDQVRPGMVESQSVVMLVAKLSSLSMFTELSPGADSTMSSIIVMLAVADALGKVRASKEVVGSKRNIAFAFLDSEPFDYTGSSQMVFSMQANAFPNDYLSRHNPNLTEGVQNVNLSSLDYVIDLEQLAAYPTADSLYLHSDPRTRDPTKFQRLLDILGRVASHESLSLAQTPDSLPLAPGPVHEFIKQSRSLATDARPLGVLLANHADSYTNLFYHGIYDDAHNIQQSSRPALVDRLLRTANLVSKAAYELAFGAEAGDGVTADRKLVDQLIDCYLVDANCSLFTRACPAGQNLPAVPIQSYNEPTRKSDDMNGMITAHLLAYLVGEKLPKLNMSACQRENELSLVYNYQYANGRDEPVTDPTSGVCIRSQVKLVSAKSPAFGYDQGAGRTTIDRKFPAWTSSFDAIRVPVRLYLRPSPIYEWCVLVLGLVLTGASLVGVRHIARSMAALKSPSPPGTST